MVICTRNGVRGILTPVDVGNSDRLRLPDELAHKYTYLTRPYPQFLRNEDKPVLFHEDSQARHLGCGTRPRTDV